ncbi:MAG: fibronectin type III domain-containing protein [Phycisphaerales bacterium]|nr:fibronectin type III domain-containing protein [Phycisphaerales bacterium]
MTMSARGSLWQRIVGGLIGTLSLAALGGVSVSASAAPPPDFVEAIDVPWDAGGVLIVSWRVDGDPSAITGWLIERREEIDGAKWVTVSELPAAAREVTATKLSHDHAHRIRVTAFGESGQLSKGLETAPTLAHANFFIGAKLPLFVGILVVSTCVIVFILSARAGRPIKIRRIAALDAVDNAVGRATEMGRPILFIAGIQDMDNISTVAGITVLGHVAKTAAEYDATIEVPTSRSLVMEAARETVQASYLSAGRSDSYNPDLIRYITDEQFGFVAYVSGRMVREKPAACFYMGCFFAESLILSETGNSIGAIQIAGTAESTQLPFFVAACDYTLIGEEFFAASSYLSREPDQMGSLKGQDAAKLITAAAIVIGVVLATLASLAPDGAFPAALTWFKGVLGS